MFTVSVKFSFDESVQSLARRHVSMTAFETMSKRTGKNYAVILSSAIHYLSIFLDNQALSFKTAEPIMV